MIKEIPHVDLEEILSTDKMDLSELISKAEDIQNRCWDSNVKKANKDVMHFTDDGLLRFINEDKKLKEVGLTKHAFSQLCNKLEIPVRYLNNCYNSGRSSLVAENVNSWLENYDKTLLLRCIDNNVRGILSSSYKKLDAPDILKVLSKSIPDKDFSIKGWYLTPERLHARIIMNDMLDIDGEDLFAGIQIDSSDVGRSTLIAKFMIYKQICTNGMVINKEEHVLFKQKHIGNALSDFKHMFTESMQRLPELILKAEGYIESARKDFSVEVTSEDFVNKIKNVTKLSDNHVDKVVELMIDNYSVSRWGLINSITEVAQDFSLERRIDLERIAGDLLVA